jgi:hypothetical protein
MPTFRSYIREHHIADWLDLLNEEAGEVHHNLRIPIPQSVLNVINLLTTQLRQEDNEAAAYDEALFIKAHALEWIFKDGLRQACLHRREFASKMTEALRGAGIDHEVQQDEVFSLKAREVYPELNEIPMEEIWKYWIEGGNEPQVIPIPMYRRAERRNFMTPSIEAINAHIKGEKFYYGGPHGLIEYMETGQDHSTGRYWKKEKRKLGARLGRHGLDLTIPDGSNGLATDPNGKQYIMLGKATRPGPDGVEESIVGGGYLPPGFDTWRDSLRHHALQYAFKIEKTKEKQSLGLPLSQDEGQLLKTIQGEDIEPWEAPKGDMLSAMGFTIGRVASGKDNLITIDDPEDYHLFKEAVRRHILELWDKSSKLGRRDEQGWNSEGNHYWYPSELGDSFRLGVQGDPSYKNSVIDKLMHVIFPHDHMRLVRNAIRLVNTANRKNNNKVHLYRWIQEGLKSLGGSKYLNVQKPIVYRKRTSLLPGGQLVPDTSQKIDIRPLAANGWEAKNLRSGEVFNPTAITLDDDTNYLHLIDRKSNRHVVLMRLPNDPDSWYKAVGQDISVGKAGNPFQVGHALGFSPIFTSGASSVGVSASRLDNDVSREAAARWKEHPEQFGDKLTNKGYLKSIIDALNISGRVCICGHAKNRHDTVGDRKFVGKCKLCDCLGFEGSDEEGRIPEKDQEAINTVWNKLSQEADTFEFKFGETAWLPTTIASRHCHKAAAMLGQNASKFAEYVSKLMDYDQWPEQGDDETLRGADGKPKMWKGKYFHPVLYRALLVNGREWRTSQARAIISAFKNNEKFTGTPKARSLDDDLGGEEDLAARDLVAADVGKNMDREAMRAKARKHVKLLSRMGATCMTCQHPAEEHNEDGECMHVDPETGEECSCTEFVGKEGDELLNQDDIRRAEAFIKMNDQTSPQLIPSAISSRPKSELVIKHKYIEAYAEQKGLLENDLGGQKADGTPIKPKRPGKGDVTLAHGIQKIQSLMAARDFDGALGTYDALLDGLTRQAIYINALVVSMKDREHGTTKEAEDNLILQKDTLLQCFATLKPLESQLLQNHPYRDELGGPVFDDVTSQIDGNIADEDKWFHEMPQYEPEPVALEPGQEVEKPKSKGPVISSNRKSTAPKSAPLSQANGTDFDFDAPMIRASQPNTSDVPGSQSAPAPQTGEVDFDFDAPMIRANPPATIQLPGPAMKQKAKEMGNTSGLPAAEHYLYMRDWMEFIDETSAVYDGTRAKDGCGFNWWGAVGKPGGTSITGEPKIRKKRKKKHGRKHKSKRTER